MTNFAPNYTGRYILKYTSGEWTGECAFRFPAVNGATPPTNFITAVGIFFNQARLRFFDNFAYESARIIPANENDSYPAATPTNAAAIAADGQPISFVAPEDSSFQVNLSGKAGTSIFRLAMGGFSGAAWIVESGPKPWRSNRAEDLVLNDMLNALVSIPTLVGPNNQTITPASYANYLYNYEYVKKNRG